MPKNMGSLDKTLRVIVAVVLAVLVFMGQITGTWAILAGVVAAVFILTSLVGTCPAYLPLGMNTCPKD